MQKQSAKASVTATQTRLVDAGIKLMRARGYNATTVDDICAEAGVTKGGFFHYFDSKEDIAKAALTRFHEERAKHFDNAPFRQLADPLDRVFGRLDFAANSSANGPRLTKGCLIGMFAQEMAFANPELRRACHDIFSSIARDFEADLAAAKAAYAPGSEFAPENLARLYVSIIQGSLMLAKADGNNEVLLQNIEMFREILEKLFGRTHGAGGIRGAEPAGHSNN